MTSTHRPGELSKELEYNERQGTEETLDAIKKLLAKETKVSAGGTQKGLSIGATVAVLTIPALATSAEIYVRTASIVFLRDGTDPTATAGFQADPGDIILLNSRDELEKFKAIRQGGTSATVDVEYAKMVSQ